MTHRRSSVIHGYFNDLYHALSTHLHIKMTKEHVHVRGTPYNVLSDLKDGDVPGETSETSRARHGTVQTAVSEVPVTMLRPVAQPVHVLNPGQARACQAATDSHPWGTPGAPLNRTVLQQHCDFFDRYFDIEIFKLKIIDQY
jgi:hypothetical protein